MQEYTVYKIHRVDPSDNRQYIGITSKTITERLRRHRSDSKRTNPKLFFWLRKHDDIRIVALETGLTKLDALTLEKNLVPMTAEERLSKGFLNLVAGGGAPKKWSELSEEEKSIRRTKIGEKHRGKIMSIESRKKMSDSHKGRTLSKEQRAKISESLQKSKTKRLTTFKLISPSGEVHAGTNVKAFCKVHNLQRGNVMNLINGKRKSHKGWKRIGD